MTLAELEDELERRLGYTSSPPAAVTTRLRAFLNLAHRRLLSRPGITLLRRTQIELTATANSPYLGVPFGIEKVETLLDQTNGVHLREVSLLDVRLWDPGETALATPWAYAVVSYAGSAFRQPGGTGLWAVSSAAGDTMGAYVETIRTGGYPHVVAATALSGTTRVQLGSLTDHEAVRKFYLASAPVGDVSLYDAAAAGNELARIPRGYTAARFAVLRLYPTPTAATTFVADVVRAIESMANATDEPILPTDFHDILVEQALVYEYRTREQNQLAAEAGAEVRQRVSDLIYSLQARLSLPTAGRFRYSRLGPWFPEGT